MPKPVPTSDAHHTAPKSVRDLQKYYQKLTPEIATRTTQILDLRDPAGSGNANSLTVVDVVSVERLREAFTSFIGNDCSVDGLELADVQVYEHNALPGMSYIYIYEYVSQDRNIPIK